MLVADARDMIQTVLSDYERFSIEGLIGDLISTLSLKGTQNEHQYHTLASVIRSTAGNIILGENIFLGEPRVREFFKGTDHPGMLPSQIAERIRLLVPSELELSPASTEASYLLQRFKLAVSDYVRFIQITNRLHLGEMSYPSESVIFRLQLPDSTYDRDLSGLSKVIETVDNFITLSAEYATGKHERPKIDYVSTSILQMFLSLDPQAAIHVLHAIKACLDAAKSAVDFRNSLKKLADNGVDQGTVNRLESEHGERQRNQLEDELKRSLSAAAFEGDPVRRKEIESRLISTSSYFVKEAQNGLVLTIERKVETITRLSLPNTMTQENAFSLVNSVLESQEQVSLALKHEDRKLLLAPIEPQQS